MASQTTKLSISPREPEGSRATRRLRRSGRVPGILYGGDAEPLTFSADARELRHALAASGAVLEVSDGGSATPAILKSAQYHPVRGETMHVDLLRVNLNVAIHAVVPLELTGGDDAPGVKEGGVLEQITRELNIEALPNAIPESIPMTCRDGHQRHDHARRRHGARRRHAARRSRGDDGRDAHPAAHRDRRGRDRGGDRARR